MEGVMVILRGRDAGTQGGREAGRQAGNSNEAG